MDKLQHSNIPRKGLEVPCDEFTSLASQTQSGPRDYEFTGKPSHVKKLIRIFSEAATVTFRCISTYIQWRCN